MAQHHLVTNPGAGASRALSQDPIVRTSRLKLNPQGFWVITYSVPDEVTGGWRSKTFSTKTKDPATAQQRLDEWLTDARDDAIVASRGRQVTVADLLDLYTQSKQLTPTCQASYIIKPLRALLGGLAPQEITERVVQEYKRLRQNSRTGGALSRSSLRRELGALITVLNHGARHKYIDRNDVPVIDLPAETAARVAFMDHAQETAFWQAAQDASDAIGLFVAIGLDTAARKSAILGLTWDRVDLQRKLIDFREPGRAVSRKRRTVVRISDRLMPVLERARARAGRPSGRLFDTKLRSAYRGFTERIGMDWVTAHVMRHTWASLAAQDGVSLYQIAQMLGDTTATVEKTYAHLQPGHLDDVINRRWRTQA